MPLMLETHFLEFLKRIFDEYHKQEICFEKTASVSNKPQLRVEYKNESNDLDVKVFS